MKIRKGDVIKHRDSMDVCFEVVSVYEGSNSWKLKGFWANQGFVNSWRLSGKTVHIQIKKENVKDLFYINSDEPITCYRNAPWVPYDGDNV